jgi:hypothetical protein
LYWRFQYQQTSDQVEMSLDLSVTFSRVRSIQKPFSCFKVILDRGLYLCTEDERHGDSLSGISAVDITACTEVKLLWIMWKKSDSLYNAS